MPNGGSTRAMAIDRPEGSLQQLFSAAAASSSSSPSAPTINDDQNDNDDCGRLNTRLVPSLIRNRMPLTQVPTDTLRTSLDPIIHALRCLDAESLLDLKPTQHGPQVSKGRHVRPIYDEVLPPLYESSSPGAGHSCVRYLKISEVPDQYSIGIFVFAPHARIPLHDHPGMCVLSRVLYGDLQRLSLDLARDQPSSLALSSNKVSPTMMSSHSSSRPVTSSAANSKPSFSLASDEKQQDSVPIHWGSDAQLSKRYKKQSWFGDWFYQQQPASSSSSTHSVNTRGVSLGNLPKGSKLAFRNHVDHLQAPDVTILYPFEGNLHEFVAGPNGAAVLDVLLPPYDNDQDRDCTFYTIHEMSSMWSNSGGKDPCYIVPTGQPENFHCIGGQYRDIGETDDVE